MSGSKELIEVSQKLINTLNQLNNDALDVKYACDNFKEYVKKERQDFDKIVNDAKQHFNNELKMVEYTEKSIKSTEERIANVESKTQRTIDALTTEYKKEIEELFNNMDSTVKKAESLQKSFGVSVDKIDDVLVQQTNDIKKLKEEVSDLKKQLEELTSVVEINFRRSKTLRSSLTYKKNRWGGK